MELVNDSSVREGASGFPIQQIIDALIRIAGGGKGKLRSNALKCAESVKIRWHQTSFFFFKADRWGL